MIRLTAPLAAPLAAMLLLSSCAFVGREGIETEVAAVGDFNLFMNLEVLSVINTRKTMGDHVATWITGKDCSTVRAQREGVWCVDWPAPPSPPAQVYCYASIAKPSCYSQPYNEGNDRLIGFVPAAIPVR
ncbi:hypothetical protein [Magnetospirillum moscoviense]|uniref:Lipoprotein n=1 Tax=Magnetospirillum moscoviense TaxID=1437059 RepID=A0A178MMJ5_9PROT|nr:hypothetical protein [Magnetospirillum moscoviense]MBF0324329.1 hypothetical protein [Alphaproteobacteria bacterium]OAN49901.1 hypothetical protein A6A05_12815 [Magnetospirillum moscoviense]